MVFFCKQFGWQDSEFHPFDGEGATTKYKQRYYDAGKHSLRDSFYGSLGLLRSLLDYEERH